MAQQESKGGGGVEKIEPTPMREAPTRSPLGRTHGGSVRTIPRPRGHADERLFFRWGWCLEKGGMGEGRAGLVVVWWDACVCGGEGVAGAGWRVRAREWAAGDKGSPMWRPEI